MGVLKRLHRSADRLPLTPDHLCEKPLRWSRVDDDSRVFTVSPFVTESQQRPHHSAVNIEHGHGSELVIGLAQAADQVRQDLDEKCLIPEHQIEKLTPGPSDQR